MGHWEVITVLITMVGAIATILAVQERLAKGILLSILAIIALFAVMMFLYENLPIKMGTLVPTPSLSPSPSPAELADRPAIPTPKTTTTPVHPITSPTTVPENSAITPAPETENPNTQRSTPKLVVIPLDQCDSPWTVEITGSEIENALAQSDRFTTILRSSLRADARRELAYEDHLDLAKSLGITHIVKGKCLKAEQENFMGLQVYLNVVVHMDLLDVETGNIVLSRNFNGRDVTQTVVVGASKDAKQTYRKMMSGFARDFARRVGSAIVR